MIQYISLKQIADDITDNPLLQDIPFERIVNYAVQLIRIVGMPQVFENKIADLQIVDYRAMLPCDFISMIQVKNMDGMCYRYTTNSFHMESFENKDYDNCKEHNEPLTYKLQGDYIYTSNREGVITISYQAIALDEEGFPMIPNNSSFIEALEYYIKKKHYSKLFDLGKIQAPVYQDACQHYAWYVGQAQSSLVKPTIDQMESITNIFNNMVVKVNDHKNGFINSGNKEYLKKQ